MAKRGKWTLKEDGTWREGPAAPRLLREDLRKLPESFIAKETGDPDKIHEWDAPHIKEALEEELWDKQFAGSEGPDFDAVIEKMPVDPGPKLDQLKIDIIKMKVIRNIIRGMEFRIKAEGFVPEGYFDPRHLWFPEDNIHKRELRPGNPPPAQERPRHLRRLDLVVDPVCWPRRMIDQLKKIGFDFPSTKELKQWKRDYEFYADMASKERALLEQVAN